MSALPTGQSPTRSRFRLSNDQKRDTPLHFIEHGVEILESLNTLGFATHRQIAHLWFTERSGRNQQPRSYQTATRAAQHSLRQLWQNGYLRRQPILLSSKTTGHGYQHFVNCLTPAGIARLAKHRTRALSAETPSIKRPVQVSNQTIEHSLAINDVFVLLSRAATAAKVGFHEWRNDRQLMTMKADHRLKLIAVPDAFFVLADGGRFCGHFLELDTGSETIMSRRSPKSWVQTIASYGAYFRDVYPRDRFFGGFTAPVVLTVTSSATRMEHLLEATKRGGGAGVYWYTTQDQLDPLVLDGNSGRPIAFDPSVLWRPIWRVLNDSSPRSLLDRLDRNPNPPKRLDRG